MADVKISAMTPAAAYDGTETYELVQAASTAQGSSALQRAFSKPLSYTYNAPAAAASLTIGNGIQALVLEPAGVIATLTVTTCAAPKDGETFIISTTQTVTALTLSPNAGQTIVNPVTTLAQNTSVRYIYRLSTTKWYRIG